MKFFTTTALLAAMAITNAVAFPVAADNAVAVGNLVHRRAIINPPSGSVGLTETKIKRIAHDPWTCDPEDLGCDGPDKIKVRREADNINTSVSDGLTETKAKRIAHEPWPCDPEEEGCDGPDKLKVKREANDNEPSGRF